MPQAWYQRRDVLSVEGEVRGHADGRRAAAEGARGGEREVEAPLCGGDVSEVTDQSGCHME